MKIGYICSSEFLYSTKLSRISISELPLSLRTWTAALQRHRKAVWLRGHSWINIYVRGPWTWVYSILGMILLGKEKTRIAFTMCLKHQFVPVPSGLLHMYIFMDRGQPLASDIENFKGKIQSFTPESYGGCVHRVVSIRRCRASRASTCVQVLFPVGGKRSWAVIEPMFLFLPWYEGTGVCFLFLCVVWLFYHNPRKAQQVKDSTPNTQSMHRHSHVCTHAHTDTDQRSRWSQSWKSSVPSFSCHL